MKQWRWAFWTVVVALAGWALTGFYSFGDPESQFARIASADGGLKLLRQRDSRWAKLRLGWQRQRVEAGYRRFLREHPTHARAMVAYGCFLYDEVREEEAVALWQRAVAVDPQLAVAYNNLGEHYSHNGHAAEALPYFDKARALAPQTAVFHYNWATVCSLFRRDAQRAYGWDDAEIFRRSLVAFQTARDLAPQNYQFANAYAATFHLMKNPDWAEAHAAWTFCLGVPPPEVERQFIYGRLSRVCMHLGRFDEAQRWLSQMTMEEVSSMRAALARKLEALRGPATVSVAATTTTPRAGRPPPQTPR